MIALRLGLVLAASLAPDDPFEGWKLAKWTHARELEERVDAAGWRDATDDLYARLARLAEKRDPSRLAAVDFGLREPYRLPALAEEISSGFELDEGDPAARLRSLFVHAAQAGGWAVAFAETLPGAGEPAASYDPLDHAATVVARAAALRERAISTLDAEDRAEFQAGWRALSLRFEESLYLFNDEDEARRLRNLELIRIGQEVDPAPMLAAAHELAGLASRTFIEALVAKLEADGADLSAPIVAQRETPHGRIVVAGRGPNRHRTGDQSGDPGPEALPAVLIDLGGDDEYFDAPGATANHTGRVAMPAVLTLDLGGNDVYESTHEGAQGAGLLGVGLLVDVAGDDSYVGLRWAQGVGLAGVGALLDLAGDDVYRAHSMAQGVGLWGVGLAVDAAGDDRYEGHRSTQGVGLPGGVGALVDRAGDDSYYCKGTYPTGYGTLGVFEGWGQGCGVGFRTNASGGIGVLADGDGADRYEGGNFSQGGGYYFGLGICVDRGEREDRWIGSRYNQGFSAHQALGYFHESGGNDVYRTRNAVASGLAWDECVTFFIDDGGDDVYEGAGFSIGASAHNSVCVFWERGGADTYREANPGRAGGNDYHGGTSLSFFLDEGGGADAYPDPTRDGAERSGGEHGLFVDR